MKGIGSSNKKIPSHYADLPTIKLGGGQVGILRVVMILNLKAIHLPLIET
jgi:hypothetical protein